MRPGCRRAKRSQPAEAWRDQEGTRSEDVVPFFAIDQERGTRPFTEREDGSWTGNPSLSDFVAQYMKSLKRGKARAGEISESVKAITSLQIRRLYEYNMRIPFSTLPVPLPTVTADRIWPSESDAVVDVRYLVPVPSPFRRSAANRNAAYPSGED